MEAILKKLVAHENLGGEEAQRCLEELLEGKTAEALAGAVLAAWTAKGETVEEITGALQALRSRMQRVDAREAIDVCGTGGDGKGTLNLSTAAALVLAGGGVRVAKHGNRAASSACGSADVLEALGADLKLSPEKSLIALEKTNFTFFFAPLYHPAMAKVASIRRALKIRTIFNYLGPMANPAGVQRQMIGVFHPDAGRRMAKTLVASGSQRVVTLWSEDGLDEVSLSAPTRLFEVRVKDGSVEEKEMILRPGDFGFREKELSLIQGGDAKHNAKALLQLLEGKAPGAFREAVVMNAAVGFYVAGKARDIPGEGRRLAEASLDSSRAKKALEDFLAIARSGS